MTVTEVEATNKENVFHKTKRLEYFFRIKIEFDRFAYFCCSLTYNMTNKFLVFLVSIFLISCDNSSNPDYDKSIPMAQPTNIAAPTPLIFTVDAVFPHDPSAFTQGLEFYNGKLYEGTGELGKSRLRIVDLKSGHVEKDHLIADNSIFGEGITIFKNKLYQLTWQNNKIFVYNLNDITTPVNTLKWSYEGWGATNDGENIIISDGSSKLYFVQPDEEGGKMKIVKIITVISNVGEINNLNELEYIDGYIFANIWHENDIVKINPENGHVVGVMNMNGLLKQYAPSADLNPEGVLNGIAYDSVSKKMFITGKLWPKLFEIKLN